MKSFSRIAVCAVAMLVAVPLFAADEAPGKGKKGGKGPQASAMMMKKLESIEFSAEQKEKLESLASALNTTMAALHKEGYSQELAKQKTEALKKAREEGKKGKDLLADVVASLEITDEQKAMLMKASEAQQAFQKGIAATLTAEQMEKLPEDVKKMLTAAKGGQGKKKAAKATAE